MVRGGTMNLIKLQAQETELKNLVQVLLTQEVVDYAYVLRTVHSLQILQLKILDNGNIEQKISALRKVLA